MGVTKQEIYTAANEIASKQQIPNIAKIRALLGKGSLNTIQKYFNNWKQDCFKHGSNLRVNTLSDNNELVKECHILKYTLTKQTQKNEELSKQLIAAEQGIAKVREVNQQLVDEIKNLQSQHQQNQALLDKYKMAYESIVSEREAAIANILADQKNLIESLRNELREVNKASIEQVKNIGRKGDDLLMEEKVKTINIKAELEQQKQVTLDLRAELNKSQELVAPLRKEIARQRKFITNVLSFEQLQEYEQHTQRAEFDGAV